VIAAVVLDDHNQRIAPVFLTQPEQAGVCIAPQDIGWQRQDRLNLQSTKRLR